MEEAKNVPFKPLTEIDILPSPALLSFLSNRETLLYCAGRTTRNRSRSAKRPRANLRRRRWRCESSKTSTKWCKFWLSQESRTLGHVTLSPPIALGVGEKGYTQDWAAILIDSSKINSTNFHTNVIDLGSDISLDELTRMMHPHPQDPHRFEYPDDRLLVLQGTIPDTEMRKPTDLDYHGDNCIIVLKRGRTTGLTIGRANNIFSSVRNYYDDGSEETSVEWAILPYDSKSGVFSAKGDSGSVVADSRGRIGGVLTGSAGTTASSDITYVTPASFILEQMRAYGMHKPNINFTLTAVS